MKKLLFLITISPVIAAFFAPYAFASRPSSTLSKKDVISALIKNSPYYRNRKKLD